MVNAIREVKDMETHLEDYRREVRDGRRERDELSTELKSLKRKLEARSHGNANDNINPEVANKPGGLKKLRGGMQILQPSKPSPASSAPTYSPRVEKVMKKVEPFLLDPDEARSRPPKDHVGKYVCRLFDGEEFYGLLASYDKKEFQVVYQDGDHQKLSVNEVMLSLADEKKVPSHEKMLCRAAVQSQSWKKKKPLKKLQT